MSTRAQIRAAIVEKLKEALPDAMLLDDPDPSVARRQKAGAIVAQLVWAAIAYEPNRMLGAAHDQAESWTWEVQILIPSRGTAAEAVAEEALEAVFDALCPSTGWSPNATGSVDCDHMTLVAEEYVGDTEDGRRLYVATYTHARQK